MSNEVEKDLNFKVDPRLHHAFKYAAAHSRVSMKDLLEDCFWLWTERLSDIKDRRLIRAMLTGRRRRK